MKFTSVVISLLVFSACQSPSNAVLPIGKVITIDGQLSEKDWTTALKLEDKFSQSAILLFQDAEWVNIANPIEKHQNLPSNKDSIKKL